MRLSVVAFFALFSFVGLSSEGDSTKVKNGILRFFLEGKVHGNIRNFTMSTLNSGDLSDYYANAMGASLHYETASFHGFKVGLNGIFIYRLFSSDLNALDSITGKTSKYERQLFDLEHPGNYGDLDRLEELYVEYHHKGMNVTLGKMEIESPMVNIHDGRMKPKVFSGVWGEQKVHHFDVHAGWFLRASPRSTTHWYTIQEAIGIYNNGCLEDGATANYHHHIQSAGLGVFGFNWKKNGISIDAWDYVIDNVSNSTLFKIDYEKDSSWRAGIMYLNQFALHNGGSDFEQHTFHRKGEVTNGISVRLGYDFKGFEVIGAGTYLFNTGRYLFPREFGVDPFYTFMSRSQLEGFGDALALKVGVTKQYKHIKFKADWNRVMVSNDLRQNKYNIPSYDQYNLDLEYAFHGKLKGLKARLLYVYRDALGSISDVLQQFNKVDFHQFNLILNFHF